MSELTFIEGRTPEALERYPDGHFTCLVTSPRYNCGKNYGEGCSDDTSEEDYLSEIRSHFRQIRRIMAPDALLFVVIGDDKDNPFRSYLVAETILRANFYLIQKLVWVKSLTLEVDKRVRTVGHYTPCNSPQRFASCEETVWVFSPSPDAVFDKMAVGVPYEHKGNIGRYGETDLKAPGNCWHVPYETTGARAKKGHPAPFPVELARRCIAVSPPGPVLDPYAGYGTVLKAASLLDRDAVCVEQNGEFIRSGIRHHGLEGGVTITK